MSLPGGRYRPADTSTGLVLSMALSLIHLEIFVNVHLCCFDTIAP